MLTAPPTAPTLHFALCPAPADVNKTANQAASQTAHKMAYSEFLTHVDKGDIASAKIHGANIEATDRHGQPISAIGPDETSDLQKRLEAKGAKFEFQPAGLSFIGTFETDNRTLTIQCLTALPFDTTISWKLNPPGGTIFKPLASTSGKPLATISGSFRTAANLAAGPVPKIVSVTPANGSTDISPTSALTFVFDQVMDTSVMLTASFPPFAIGNFDLKPTTISSLFTGSWGTDQKTLTFTPAVALPSNTTVTWTLNPAGSSTPLQSATGQPLATATGSYQVISSAGGSTNELCQPATGVPGSYGVSKNFSHQQTAAGVVIPNPNNPATFNVFVQSPAAGPAVTDASITLPGGSVNALTNLFGTFSLYVPQSSEAALESAYPAGAYTLRLDQTGQAQHVIAMTMPVTPTSIPTSANFDAAQAIDATQSFTLRWNAFTPQGPGAAISVVISDQFGNLIFLAPNPCVPRALASTDTSVVIPANYLRPGLTYNGQLQFGNSFFYSTNAVPKMSGYGNISRVTSFTLKTTGTSGGPGGGIPTGQPANFTGFRLLPNGHPQLDVSGTPAQSYTILRAASLMNPLWITVGNATMNPMGTTVFEDIDRALTFPAFYKAVNN